MTAIAVLKTGTGVLLPRLSTKFTMKFATLFYCYLKQPVFDPDRPLILNFQKYQTFHLRQHLQRCLAKNIRSPK